MGAHVVSAPLRSYAPSYEVRSVTCPCCGGQGCFERVVNLRYQQDVREVACQCNAGRVEVRLLAVDADLARLCPSVEGADYAVWCPSLGLLAALDEHELESGNWPNPWVARDAEDQYLVAAMGDL